MLTLACANSSQSALDSIRSQECIKYQIFSDLDQM